MPRVYSDSYSYCICHGHCAGTVLCLLCLLCFLCFLCLHRICAHPYSSVLTYRAVARWASRAVPIPTSSTSCQCRGTGSISPKGPKTSPAHPVRKACSIAVVLQRWPRGQHRLLEGVSTPRRCRDKAQLPVRVRQLREVSEPWGTIPPFRILVPMRFPGFHRGARTSTSPHRRDISEAITCIPHQINTDQSHFSLPLPLPLPRPRTLCSHSSCRQMAWLSKIAGWTSITGSGSAWTSSRSIQGGSPWSNKGFRAGITSWHLDLVSRLGQEVSKARRGSLRICLTGRALRPSQADAVRVLYSYNVSVPWKMLHHEYICTVAATGLRAVNPSTARWLRASHFRQVDMG